MKVKICGITNSTDAQHAANVGADYIGMIFCHRSRRNVTKQLAKQIVEITKYASAIPVGVFVDQTVESIISICEHTGITAVQLHGAISKNALYDLPGHYSIIYAISVQKTGEVLERPSLPPSVIPLYDNSEPGSGVPFDWRKFGVPQARPWMLSGGLNPTNIEDAIKLLNPDGVDVATGVEYPNSTRKDPALVQKIILKAKERKENL